jgi:hypothetical protein
MVDGTEHWLRSALAEYAAGFGEHTDLLDPQGELTAALTRFAANPYAVQAWRSLEHDLRGMSDEMRRLVAFDVFWIVERSVTDRSSLGWASPDDAEVHGQEISRAIDALLGMDDQLLERACVDGRTGSAVDDFMASRGTWIPHIDSRVEYASMLRNVLLGLRKDVSWWVASNADEARASFALTHRDNVVRELNELFQQHLGQTPAEAVAGLVNATCPKLPPLSAAEVAHLIQHLPAPALEAADPTPDAAVA